MRHKTLALSLLLCLPLAAQSPRIDVGDLKKLGDAAVECAEVSLDGMALRWALGVLKGAPETYDLVKGIKGIYVHNFEFDEDGKFSNEDLEKVRQQVKTPPWERIVSTKSKKDGEDVDVYILADHKTGAIKGLVVIAVEKREVSVVNIVGSIDLEGLSRLEGSLGVPKLNLAGGAKGD